VQRETGFIRGEQLLEDTYVGARLGGWKSDGLLIEMLLQSAEYRVFGLQRSHLFLFLREHDT
jgi:hypothetical protein